MSTSLLLATCTGPSICKEFTLIGHSTIRCNVILGSLATLNLKRTWVHRKLGTSHVIHRAIALVEFSMLPTPKHFSKVKVSCLPQQAAPGWAALAYALTCQMHPCAQGHHILASMCDAMQSHDVYSTQVPLTLTQPAINPVTCSEPAKHALCQSDDTAKATAHSKPAGLVRE